MTVLYFASLADRVGVRSEIVEVVPGETVEGLWSRLCDTHAGLADLGVRPMVALDRAYAEWTRSLDGVGEVAFLPPVSGG